MNLAGFFLGAFALRKPDLPPPALALPVPQETGLPDPNFRIGVFSHIYYPELIPELFELFAHLGSPAEYHFTTDTEEKAALIERARPHGSKYRATVQVAPNRGRDIAPRLSALCQHGDKYDVVLMIHSKISPHDHRLSSWRHFLLSHLLGSRQVVEDILGLFHLIPELGMVAPRHFEKLGSAIGWGENEPKSHVLARRLGLKLRPNAQIDFPSGSMFWARPAALSPLLEIGLTTEDYEEEVNQLDGTMAHAVERLFYLSCEKAGFSWLNIAQPDQFQDHHNIYFARTSDEIRALLRHDLLKNAVLREALSNESSLK